MEDHYNEDPAITNTFYGTLTLHYSRVLVIVWWELAQVPVQNWAELYLIWHLEYISKSINTVNIEDM